MGITGNYFGFSQSFMQSIIAQADDKGAGSQKDGLVNRGDLSAYMNLQSADSFEYKAAKSLLDNFGILDISHGNAVGGDQLIDMGDILYYGEHNTPSQPDREQLSNGKTDQVDWGAPTSFEDSDYNNRLGDVFSTANGKKDIFRQANIAGVDILGKNEPGLKNFKQVVITDDKDIVDLAGPGWQKKENVTDTGSNQTGTLYFDGNNNKILVVGQAQVNVTDAPTWKL